MNWKEVEIETASKEANPKAYFLQDLGPGYSGNINEITPGMDSEYPKEAKWLWMAAYNPNIYENYVVAGWGSDLDKVKMLVVKAIDKIGFIADDLHEDINDAKIEA